MKLILTCEHGGNEIPSQYLRLFETAGEDLDSHRGYDPGALDLFLSLRKFASFEKYETVSRLLVELNRSLHHRQLFSEYTKELPSEEKKKILDKYYFPYRHEVEAKIAEDLQGGEKILHLSVHTFTPRLHSEVRNADIGLLYDPGRKLEKEICSRFKELLLRENPNLRIRFNYPYLGSADGFTTYLRKKFPTNYAGIEIEVNQKFVENDRLETGLKNAFFKALLELLKEFEAGEK